jgi:hypothetical protein
MTRNRKKKRKRQAAEKQAKNRRTLEARALMAKAIAQRKTLPVVVDPKRVQPLGERTIPCAEIHQLNVAEVITTKKGYQRGQNTGQINEIQTAISLGGYIPDPIVLSERGGKLWIVEGQQRAEASRRAGKDVLARVFHCASIEDERTLFLAFDAKKKVSADVIVAGHPGFISRLMVSENEREDSLIRHHIDFGRHGGRRFGATPLARALARVAVGETHFGRAVKWLDRVDAQVQSNEAAKMRARRFLDLVMLVWGVTPANTRVRTLWVESLAVVAQRRWRNGTPMPTSRMAGSIRRLDWGTIAPAHRMRFMQNVVGEIELKWKVSSGADHSVAS